MKRLEKKDEILTNEANQSRVNINTLKQTTNQTNHFLAILQ